jgi:hypothetical protein
VSLTNITGGQNWDQSYAGSGMVDDAIQAFKAFAIDDDWLSGFANITAGGLGVLDAFDNPTKAIGTSIIGWLLEHISFLDAFLDQTAGDANAVQAAYQQFYDTGKTIDGIAADQITVFGTQIDTYRRGVSPSAQAFEKRMRPRGEQLKTLSVQCHGLGEAMNKAGMLVATCRGMMRDLLADFTWWVFEKARVAVALATYTCGGSLATLMTETCVSAAGLAKDLVGKLGALTRDLSELRGLVANLYKVFFANALPSSTKEGHDSAVSDLTAADAAERKVAQQDVQEEKERQDKVHPHGSMELPDPVYPPPAVPLPEPKKPIGPGLGVKWTASGTLDE